jgi:hypothetical protein
MRYLTLATTFIAALMVGMVAAPAAAQYDSNAERLAKLTSPSDVFYFFEGARKQVTAYDSERIVRVCLGDNRHLVPLRVIHDDDTATVNSDECIRVEAKEVFLEPAEPLESNATIRAEVQTMN